jgi:hypothetical protein
METSINSNGNKVLHINESTVAVQHHQILTGKKFYQVNQIDPVTKNPNVFESVILTAEQILELAEIIKGEN